MDNNFRSFDFLIIDRHQLLQYECKHSKLIEIGEEKKVLNENSSKEKSTKKSCRDYDPIEFNNN